MKNIKYLYLIVLIGFVFSSCQEWIDKDEVEIEYSAAWPITGEWNVSEYYDTGDGFVNAYGPYGMNLFNSSFSEDSIWIDNLYDSGIKIKAQKTGTTTFVVTGAPDVNGVIPGDWTIDVIGGEIVGTDSIIMNVVIYMGDGTVYDDYYEAGPRMTGFEGFE